MWSKVYNGSTNSKAGGFKAFQTLPVDPRQSADLQSAATLRWSTLTVFRVRYAPRGTFLDYVLSQQG